MQGSRSDRGTPLTELPLVARARGHGDRPAIIAAEGTFTYRELLDASDSLTRVTVLSRVRNRTHKAGTGDAPFGV